jgi:hypothetical protein
LTLVRRVRGSSSDPIVRRKRWSMFHAGDSLATGSTLAGVGFPVRVPSPRHRTRGSATASSPAPIDFEIADDLARWRVEVPGKARGSAEALTGPTAPEGARVQVHNAPGAEVGPGQVATWATAKEDEVNAFGFQWSWPGRSSKHFPFDWSGPDEA